MSSPWMVTIADPGAVELAAFAACFVTCMCFWVVLHMLVLARATQDPCALSHDEREARALALGYPAGGLCCTRLQFAMFFETMPTHAARLGSYWNALVVTLSTYPCMAQNFGSQRLAYGGSSCIA
uniref:Uncharacterized protein n=1 Tax=Chlamydomonas euryale TaxID=1486919 RepID=A0A7R9Z4D8_9CHLO